MTFSVTEVDAILNAAIELPTPAEREDYVGRVCGDNAELRERIDQLLAAHFQAGDFLELPPTTLLNREIANIQEGPGTVIGPYKLLQQIGEGGMGVVFMAEQTRPVQRTVALKIIKPGMDTRQVIARFEAERQALALMDHPNIARVLDAGTTETGRPYFVMDLVKGVPITEYCDQQQLPIRDRLTLMTDVCHAVQHAHQKGIIHRDLKPSNVLVAEYDGKPVPKVIDFGVAKATAQKLTERTMFTEYGQLIGTFEYMSPEQARFNQLDVDTRSDIYSLGVLLYELLAGSTPLDRERLRSAAFDEILRMIGEEEPPKPSTRLSSSQKLPSIAANRHTEPDRLRRALSGELDWIVMKCLEKDRNRRYETANALGVDVYRYLNDQPIEARPVTQLYRLKKFIRRNKVGSLAAAALVLGLAFAVVGFVQARRQAQIARTQASRSEHVATFLKDMLAAAGPTVARGRDVTVLQEILDQTAERVDRDLKEQPEVEVELKQTIGEVYQQLGEYVKAGELHRQSLALHERLLGNEHPTVANTLDSLARSLWKQGKLAEAEAIQRKALAMRRKLLGNEHSDVALSLNNLARVLYAFNKNELAEAEACLREALAIQREHSGKQDSQVSITLKNLAGVLDRCGKLDEAEDCIRESIEIQRKHLDHDEPIMADSLDTLANVLRSQGRFEEAETVRRESLTMRRKLLGNAHPDVAISFSRLVEDLRRQKKDEEAEAVVRESRAAIKQRNAGNHNSIESTLNSLEELLKSQGKPTGLDALVPEEQAGIWVYNTLQKVASTNSLAAWQLAIARHSEPQDIEKALKLATVSVGIVPDSGDYWCVLALCHYRLGHMAKSTEILQKAMDFPNRGNGWGWFLIAMAEQNSGNAAAAKASYEKGIHWMETHPLNERVIHFRREAAVLLGVDLQSDHLRRLPATKRLFNPQTGHDYQRIDVVMDWNEAQECCSLLGGHLATVSTNEENEFLFNHFGTDHVCWLGANDELEDGQWAWVTGELWQYKNWQSNEPSDTGGGESYLSFGNRAPLVVGGRIYFIRFGAEWNDLAESGNYWGVRVAHPICEWDDHNPQVAVEAPAIVPMSKERSARLQLDEQITAFHEAVRQRPENANYLNQLAWLLATDPDPRRRDLAQANVLAQKAVQLSPADGTIWNTLGVAQFRAGKWRSAINSLKSSMEFRDGGDSSDWFFLAMAHWQLGQKDEARTLYDKAVEWMDKNAPKNVELLRFRAETADLLGITQPQPATDSAESR